LQLYNAKNHLKYCHIFHSFHFLTTKMTIRWLLTIISNQQFYNNQLHLVHMFNNYRNIFCSKNVILQVMHSGCLMTSHRQLIKLHHYTRNIRHVNGSLSTQMYNYTERWWRGARLQLPNPGMNGRRADLGDFTWEKSTHTYTPLWRILSPSTMCMNELLCQKRTSWTKCKLLIW
jgi:hypothetical protein